MTSNIPFQILDFGQTPLEERFVPEPQAFVFSSTSDWKDFWQSSTVLDLNLQKPPAPSVDFQQQTIVGITSGSRTTGGYGIHIDRIEPNLQGNRWIIHYTESVPAHNCVLTQEPTTPSVFITVKPPVPPLELQGQTIVNESC
ncbi:protease complex subunit PrcB family protein [Nodosilinea sp. E11]|uniref:protease complex subunit PrcB family protein n=1 Tax=Nodosilinea sp. E11 TaxID=3037479 RepID=UPI002934DCBA|nr:protease complex subunit PrcB family protein [Nodosilinea sp. E11]WOD40810.1 protease complex subunit PrcB family protein [Nodosilinea sp. E11]